MSRTQFGADTSGERSYAASSPSSSVQIWGVLNVTPDSFSDGGRFLDPAHALDHAARMASEGAHVIDVGGASSRPPGSTYGAGAAVVDETEELRRVLPVVRALAARGHRVSIDTTRGLVARACLDAGATIVNDVSMGGETSLLEATAAHRAELVLMHNRGDGRVEGPRPMDIVALVRSELEEAVCHAVEHGIDEERIWIDPGIGFAKTAVESAHLLARLGELSLHGDRGPHRVLVGASRKSFLAVLAPDPDGAAPLPSERLGASLAAVTAAVLGGASAVRVHDVASSRQAALVAAALRTTRGGTHG